MHGQYRQRCDSFIVSNATNIKMVSLESNLESPSAHILIQSLPPLTFCFHSHSHRRLFKGHHSQNLSFSFCPSSQPPLPTSASTPAIVVSRQWRVRHCTVRVWVPTVQWCCDVWICRAVQTRLLQKCSIRALPPPSTSQMLLHSSELLAKAALCLSCLAGSAIFFCFEQTLFSHQPLPQLHTLSP